VETVFSRIGTAEVATDPMPPNIADTYVMLKPRREWPDPDRPKEDLIDAIGERIARLLGSNYEFTQPIEMRFNELLAGVRADVAVKVFGDDMEVLRENAERIAAVL
jgi:heavy metal efflux system protein